MPAVELSNGCFEMSFESLIYVANFVAYGSVLEVHWSLLFPSLL